MTVNGPLVMFSVSGAYFAKLDSSPGAYTCRIGNWLSV